MTALLENVLKKSPESSTLLLNNLDERSKDNPATVFGDLPPNND